MAGLTEQDRPAQVRRRARRSNRLDISSAQAEISNSELGQSTFPEEIPWRDPAPLYQSLPNEIQELILKAASNPGTPTMRFVSLRQAVIHETDACRRIPPIPGCLCYRHRPNYITFWPLRRQFIMDSAEWRVLCRSTNSRPPRDAIAATNSQGRAVVQRSRRLDPFPQKQGDWSLTKVVLEEAMPAHEIGDPYNCNSGDLILVHIPNTWSTGPFLYSSLGNPHRQVTWDPLLEQLTSVAMNIVNWDTLSYDGGLESIYRRMTLGHTWELEAQQGTRNLLHGQVPNVWPPPARVGGNVWHPNTPQRHIRQPAHLPRCMTFYSNRQPDWVQNIRLLTDVFPALRELYLVNFDGFNTEDDTLREKMHNYLDTPHDGPPCGRCDRRHPGKPKTWAGLEEIEFAEVRLCAARGLEVDLGAFDTHRFFASHSWPSTDVHGNPWTRPLPQFKLVVPILRRR
ncbi:hypothetical protein LZ32DRAFT_104511 [Colletotrichum eremochloae]|nr:hypothetical protein LZ32DRAFT_104511 [Colletotrichum eremochloae]